MPDRNQHDNQMSSRLLAQLLNAAHMGITEFVKTQQPIYIACDADANAFANPANPLRGRGQPKRAGTAQVRSVLPEINLQCLSQSPRASAEVGQACRVTRTVHHFADALQ